MLWSQDYNPMGAAWVSTLMAVIPLVVLLGGLAVLRWRAPVAAIAGLLAAIAVAVGGFGMPIGQALGAAGFGAAYGLMPIGWIVLNIIFLYQLTEERGQFAILRDSIAGITDDSRLQLLLVAFCFGAFFEGTAGFGSPVAVTSALLMQLGFRPLQACGLSLIANTAPVAFGAMGTPLQALHDVTNIDLLTLSKMAGRQLPFFSLIVPAWVVCAHSGWRGLRGVWPAALTAGVGFAVPQFLVSNFHGPWLVDIIASLCSMGAVVLLLKVWRPRDVEPVEAATPFEQPKASSITWQCWLPWILLCGIVFAWGLQPVKAVLDHASQKIPVPALHELVQRTPPVAPAGAATEKAIFKLDWISTPGTGILLAAMLSGLLMGFSPKRLVQLYANSLWKLRLSLLTIAAMLALGYVTKFSGTDATLGLALAHTGWLYPFFSALLGWLGVALTGSDTASNVLFGSLQTITAQQVGVSPTLLASANSTGGVMGKMIDAQSIVVASTATGWYGHEGSILRFVFVHSIVLASLVGLLVLLQAYVWPFTQMVP